VQLEPARKPLELAEPGERRLKLYVRTQLPNLIMGFNVPSLGSSENPREVNALRLIGALLDGGYSARLASRLERGEELVAGASTYYDAFNRGDSLFVLSATPNVQKGKTLEQVEAGLWKQLDDLKQNPPSAAEIERVRAQMIAGMVYEKDSIAAQASSIGQLESVGLSWKLIDQDLEALKAVTPDDIQKAARTYFTPSRLTLAQVLPVKAEEKEARHE
ncbi:M16 family metallopeptidase, partial [Pseudomonas aeruginosa]|uniref:M16 family metallopeptidase n=1 Tax=Pseudomonas aeruginosa TaxID=287 RepID=UPI0005C76EFA